MMKIQFNISLLLDYVFLEENFFYFINKIYVKNNLIMLKILQNWFIDKSKNIK